MEQEGFLSMGFLQKAGVNGNILQLFINFMTIRNILEKYNNKEILDKLFLIYPDEIKSKGGYQSVLQRLRKLKQMGSKMVLYPHKFDTYGKYLNIETRYAIDFTRWEEWLGMKIETKTSYLNALCYCLWEMTYHGFSQQPIQRRINKLNKIVKEALNQKDKV